MPFCQGELLLLPPPADDDVVLQQTNPNQPKGACRIMSTITKPVNIWKFIEENKDSLKPPVNNKVV